MFLGFDVAKSSVGLWLQMLWCGLLWCVVLLFFVGGGVFLFFDVYVGFSVLFSWLLVVVFFSCSLLVLHWVSRFWGFYLVYVMLFFYGLKVGLVFLFLGFVGKPFWLNDFAVFFMVLVTVCVWVGSQVYAFGRARHVVFDV